MNNMSNDQEIKIDKQIEIHLKEYEMLCGGIGHYINRLDTYIGIYVAALFSIIIFFLNPNSEYNIASYFQRILKDSYSIGFMLLIPILNSILQILLLSFMHAILAFAKYSTYIIGDKLSKLVQSDVLLWDKHDKKYFITTSSIAGILSYLCVLLISLSILFLNLEIILLKKGAILFWLYFIGIILVSLSIAYLIQYIIIGKNFHRDLSSVKIPKIRQIFIIIFLLLIISVIIIA